MKVLTDEKEVVYSPLKMRILKHLVEHYSSEESNKGVKYPFGLAYAIFKCFDLYVTTKNSNNLRLKYVNGRGDAIEHSCTHVISQGLVILKELGGILPSITGIELHTNFTSDSCNRLDLPVFSCTFRKFPYEGAESVLSEIAEELPTLIKSDKFSDFFLSVIYHCCRLVYPIVCDGKMGAGDADLDAFISWFELEGVAVYGIK